MLNLKLLFIVNNLFLISLYLSIFWFCLSHFLTFSLLHLIRVFDFLLFEFKSFNLWQSFPEKLCLFEL